MADRRGGGVAAACVIVVMLGLFGQFEPGTPGGNMLVSCGLVAPHGSSERGASEERGEDGGKEGGKPRKGTTPADELRRKSEKNPPRNPAPSRRKISRRKTCRETDDKPSSGVPAPNGGKAAGNVQDPAEAGQRSGRGAEEDAAGRRAEAAAQADDKPPCRRRKPRATWERSRPRCRPLEPEPLGRLLSSEQVLLSDNPPNGWTRVAANQMLIPQQVLALPTYRPKVGLTAGVTVEILGGTPRRIVGQQSARKCRAFASCSGESC